MMKNFTGMVALLTFVFTGLFITVPNTVSSQENGAIEYKVLATSKTSTMKKEMNQAAAKGFRFQYVMGGETAFGGKEVVVVMSRMASMEEVDQYEYRLQATSKTSTMQKEIQSAGDEGFEYRGQTIFNSLFGGQEVVVILERDKTVEPVLYQYKLQATSKTSTMQKELSQVGADGFEIVGLTVAKTRFGGKELVAITRKVRDE